MLHVFNQSVSWDDSVSIAELESQLSLAIRSEEYERAAKIRDALQQKQSNSRLAVEDANRKFYEAFMSGNIEAMDEVWGHGDHIQVVHPGTNVIAGRELVMESWRKVLKNVRPRAFKIELEDVRVYASEDSAYVTCVELVDADDSQGRIVATNIFMKQDGRWVLTLHHGSPAPALRIRIS